MKKIAVVLSGCGHQDGSEITESVSTLIVLSQLGVEHKIFAPSLDFKATNHLSGETEASRNTLVEAARLARGSVEELNLLDPALYDGLIFTGGYGAAQHLCDWASKGSECSVHPDVERVIKTFHDQSKPIGAMCIAPVLIAKVLGPEGVTVTIGDDKETASEIAKTGAVHTDCAVEDYITDREFKTITTPAYMYDAKPSEVFKGISGALRELVEMA